MYAILDTVVQTVLTDKDADIAALLTQADADVTALVEADGARRERSGAGGGRRGTAPATAGDAVPRPGAGAVSTFVLALPLLLAFTLFAWWPLLRAGRAQRAAHQPGRPPGGSAWRTSGGCSTTRCCGPP